MCSGSVFFISTVPSVMAWMTYISHWFDEDDWYEGQERVRIV